MSGFSVPQYQFWYQGVLAAGGSLNVYQTGTTTPVTVYSDGGLTTPITNPITLDANGEAKFYVSGSVNLRFDAYTSQGAFIQTIDPVYPTTGAAASTGMVVYQGTNLTLATTNNGNNIVSTAPINIALPISTGFSNSFSVELNAQGGAITLVPNAADAINKQSVGTNYVLASGLSALLWTDAAGNWGLNFLTSAAPTIYFSAIAGCLPSAIAGSSTTASITVGTGQATNSANTAVITSAGYSWAASNGNAINGTDAASSTLANSTTYHMYLISGTSGTGTFCSATYPSPTFPTGYTTSKRRIFSFNTTGAGAPIPYTAIESEGGSTINWLTTQLLDINVANQGTSRVLYTLTVPTGVKVQPLYRGSGATGSVFFIYTSGDESDVAPTASGLFNVAPGYDWSDSASFATTPPRDGVITTNTSGQIGCRANTGTTNTFYWITRGFKDFRRA